MAVFDSKDKKFSNGIEKALASFDTVEEWADYIAFLSKLLKSLQQKHSTLHWIPHDLKISIILSKCLSQNLPSGVHQKTLELYNFIFKELGIDALSNSVDVWIPGVLPIMQFASISIKPLVIDLYKNYILTLPSSILKILIKPILSYLLPSIDDETSEFFESSLDLIGKLKLELNDDLLFWQSIFIIIITSDERRLGCLVWFTKRLPDLDVVIEPPTAEDLEKDPNETTYYHNRLLNVLSADQSALISPEPGLLIRSFIASLQSENILIQRGYFDLLIKKLPLNSAVLQNIAPKRDLEQLIISTATTVLKKDMSLNRRVWTWLLGLDESSSTTSHLDFFKKNGSELLTKGLLKLINGDYDQSPPSQQKLLSFKISLAFMDRWEIGSEVIPVILLPVLKSIKQSVDSKSSESDEILKRGTALFDGIETLTIFSNIFQLVNDENVELLNLILRHFNVHDEEMVVHQLPLLLISSLLKGNFSSEWFSLYNTLLEAIPQRAFLPIEHALKETQTIKDEDILARIGEYFEGDDVLNVPFKPADLALIILNHVSSLVIKHTQEPFGSKYIDLLNIVIDTIPELSFKDPAIVEILETQNFAPSSVISISKLFTKLKFTTPYQRIAILRVIVTHLCSLLAVSGNQFQVEVVRTLHSLTFEISPYYVEAAIASYMLSLDDFSKILTILNYLWIHSTDTTLLDRPLHILLDKYHKDNNPLDSILESWILNTVSTGHANRLFQLITFKLNSTSDDPKVFTYHVNLISKVLRTDIKRLLPLFKEELLVVNSIEYKDENVSTYKDYTLFELSKFLNQTQFDTTALNSIFKLFELLLDGSESIFEDHVTTVFHLSKTFITENSNADDYDATSIVLLNHLSGITKLLINTHHKVTDVLIKKVGPDEKVPLLIQFLLTSFAKFRTQELLSSWIELLSNSLKFQDAYIFEYVEPIVLTVLDKINELFGRNELAKDDVAISLLLGLIQEVLSLFRTYVISIEVNNDKIQQNDPGFFTSVVSGVFNTDNNKKSEDDDVSKSRQTLIICFKNVTESCFKIWESSDLVLKQKKNDHLSLNYQSMKLKHRAKLLLESLYTLEPIETLKTLILLESENDGLKSVFRLLHVLDGTRPQLTIPHIFSLFKSGIIQRNFDYFDVSGFLIDYTISLQNDSIEDIYLDSINFLKGIIADINIYKPALYNILKFISVIAEKLNHSKFGTLKKVKKELSEIFLKILPNAVSVKNNDIISALSTNINDSENSTPGPIDTGENASEVLASSTINSDRVLTQEEISKTINFIIPRLNYVVPESDKQNVVISTILVNLLTPKFKGKSFPNNIQNYHLELLSELSKYFPTSKNLRFLISETFNNSQFFKINIVQVGIWNTILSNWLGDDTSSSEKVFDYLNKVVQSSTTNIFNWNENEQLYKSLILRRISYLILISPKDRYIVLLGDLFNKLDQLTSQNDDLPLLIADIFLLIRVIVLRFSSIHLYDHWTFIYTTLQGFFKKILESSESVIAKLDINSILQGSKLLDVLLVLKFEDFQEWIFIIDTINAIFKNVEIISLIDKISLRDEIFVGDAPINNEKVSIADKLTKAKSLRRPILVGMKEIKSLASLKPFFDGLSYYNYENVYNSIAVDYDSCDQDVYIDLFDDKV